MTTRNTIQRNRALQILILLLVIAAGIASRKYPWILPASLGKYPGDALWALAVVVLWGLILPRATTMKIAGLAFLTSVLDEISQLYHAPWIDSIRSTSIGHLLLGFSFSWMDILAYATGILGGIIIESLVRFSHKH